MHCKDACLIVDLREGQDLAEITNMIAILSAAGWKTDIALKVYGGETLKLARKAAKQGYDAIIAYGGDGTLNQVINGVMDVDSKSIVGVIPGGTANEWAGEISVPGDHVDASLARDGYRVTVVGSVPDPAKPHTYIIAGNMHKQNNDEIEPVAVRVDGEAAIIKRSGEYLSPASLEQLQEGF